MDGPGDYYAERNKPVRERRVSYDFTYMWNLNKSNKQNRNRFINTENRRTAVRGEGGRGAG